MYWEANVTIWNIMSACAWVDWEKPRETLDGTAGLRAEIQTRDLQNTGAKDSTATFGWSRPRDHKSWLIIVKSKKVTLSLCLTN
jgi:hypothetical protein